MLLPIICRLEFGTPCLKIEKKKNEVNNILFVGRSKSAGMNANCIKWYEIYPFPPLMHHHQHHHQCGWCILHGEFLTSRYTINRIIVVSTFSRVSSHSLNVVSGLIVHFMNFAYAKCVHTHTHYASIFGNIWLSRWHCIRTHTHIHTR